MNFPSFLRVLSPVRLCHAVFGRVQWTPPGWLLKSTGVARRRWRGMTAGLVVVAAAGLGGWRWYVWHEAHKPRPREFVKIQHTGVRLSVPDLSVWEDKKLVPKVLVVNFDSSAAPLEKAGKVVTEGVQLSPAFAGTWKWEGDKMLVFRPEADWPAGVKVAVKMEPEKLVQPAVKLDAVKWEFMTKPVAAQFDQTSLYTDPRDPSVHQVVSRLTLTHAVTAEELQPHLAFTLLGGTPVFNKADPPVALVADENPRVFFVRSARLSIPEKTDTVKLTITPGCRAASGGEPAPEGAVEKMTLPSVYDGLKIAGISMTIVRNEEGEPGQVLFIDTTDFTKPAEVAAHVSARFVPPGIDYAGPNGVKPEELAKMGGVKLTPVPVDDPMPKRHAFRVLVEKPGRLLVTVTKELPSLSGYRLQHDHAEFAAVPEFPRELALLGKGGILALNGEKKMSVKTRGLDGVRYTLARIPQTQINHLVSQTSGDFASPYFNNYRFDEQNIGRISREVRPLVKKNDYEAGYTSFDFTDALKAAEAADPSGGRGLFLVTVTGLRKKDDAKPLEEANWNEVINGEKEDGSDSEADARARRFVLITDLGLLVKDNADGSRDVFVQSIKAGEPVAGVQVEVLAKNGEPVGAGTTDAQGHTLLADVSKLKHEHEPVALVARHGADLSFLPFDREDRQLDMSRFETEGLTASEAEKLDAFLFTERGIYRPGDTVHAGVMVRRRNFQTGLEGLPVKLTVTNAREETVQETRLNLPADGLLDIAAPTKETWPTGIYRASLHLTDSDGETLEFLGRTLFRVEDFQPERTRVTAVLNGVTAAGWIAPKDLKADVTLATLFGQPAGGRRVTGVLDLSPSGFAFEAFPGYVFHHGKEKSEAGKKVELGEQTSDAAGHAAFDLGADRLAGAAFQLDFTAEAFEPDGGRSVRAQTGVLISERPWVLGWKADGDLAYVGKDTERSVHFIALGPDLKPVTPSGLTQRLIISRHVSVLTKQDNGNYAYVSTLKEETVAEAALVLAEGGLKVPLRTSEPGRFRLEVLDDAHELLSACSFTVAGKGESGRSLDRNAELDLTLAKRTVAPGSPLELALSAPYTGAGLITIEREKVLAWQWFKSPATSGTQTIVVPESLEGSAYASVSFVRDLASPEVFMSPLSYAVQPFAVDPVRRRLAVELDAPKLIRPGSTVKLGYRTAVPSRLVLYAVDEGIHRVTNYRLPDPLSHFFRKRALEVGTTQILDLIIPEFSLLGRSRAFGGDGGDAEALRMNLNPFKRRREAPVVLWSGLVEAGPERREIEWTAPDYFDGGLNVMAVAVAADRLGTGSTHAIVRGPFVLAPNAPFFVAPGDEFTASLSVTSNMEAAQTVTVQAAANGLLEITGPAPEPVSIEPGRDATVRVQVRAREMLGNAELTFTATAGQETVTRKTTLSVRPAAPFLTRVQSGSFRQDAHEVAVGRSMFPQFARRETAVGLTPLGLAKGLAGWLRDYPHGCSEQITSRAFAGLLLSTEADFGFSRADSAAEVQSVITTLRSRQNGDGSFGYWHADGGSGLNFVSIYVTQFLTEAKAAGYDVPKDMLDQARSHLRTVSMLKPQGEREAGLIAEAIYLLTRNGEVTTNAVLNLRDNLGPDSKAAWRHQMAAAWLAATSVLLQQPEEGEKLMRGYRERRDASGKRSPWYDDEPLTRDSQALALIFRHFPKIAGELNADDLALVTGPLGREEFSTLSAASAIMALKAWAGLAAQSGVQTSVAEITTDPMPKLLAPASSGLTFVPFTESAVRLKFQRLRPAGAPDLTAFYQITEAGFDRGLPAERIADGLEVLREVMDEKGAVVAACQVGDPLTIRLRLRNLGADRLDNLAVLDLLPGGFELVPGGLKPGAGTMPGTDYVDVREDRNVFFAGLSPNKILELTYRLKATCAGTFTLPPAFAESMYDRAIKSRAGGGKITVTRHD